MNKNINFQEKKIDFLNSKKSAKKIQTIFYFSASNIEEILKESELEYKIEKITPAEWNVAKEQIDGISRFGDLTEKNYNHSQEK